MEKNEFQPPHDWLARVSLILSSYRHWLGRDLIASAGVAEANAAETNTAEEQAKNLFHAPFVVVAHGLESDPLLMYGNQAALELWEVDLQTLLRTPSRLTAEPVHRDERARLLARTARDGFVDDYQGIRVSSTGRRFYIEQARVWNLLDSNGKHAGQAATFSQWRDLPS